MSLLTEYRCNTLCKVTKYIFLILLKSVLVQKKLACYSIDSIVNRISMYGRGKNGKCKTKKCLQKV